MRFRQVLLAAPPPAKPRGAALDLVGARSARTAAAQRRQSHLRWQLLTTLPVTTLAEACERIGWYAQRWQIEVIHKVLKSSCQIEQRHLETAARLEVAVTTTHVVAGILPAVEPSVSRGGKSVIIANGCRFSQAMGKFARPFRAAGETSDATFTDRHLQSDPCQPV